MAAYMKTVNLSFDPTNGKRVPIEMERAAKNAIIKSGLNPLARKQ